MKTMRMVGAAVCLLAMVSISAWADPVTTATWTGLGADGDTSTVANWDSDPNPVATSGATITFDGDGNDNRLVNHDNYFTSLDGLVFSAGAESYTIEGDTITFASGGTRLTNNSTSAQTIDAPIAGAGTTTFTGADGSHTYLTANLSGFDILSFQRSGGTATYYVSGNNSYNETWVNTGRVLFQDQNAMGTGMVGVTSTIGRLINDTGSAWTLSNTLRISHTITYEGYHPITFEGGIFMHSASLSFNITDVNSPFTVTGDFVWRDFPMRNEGEIAAVEGRRDTPFVKTGAGTLVLGLTSFFVSEQEELDYHHWRGGVQVNAGALVLVDTHMTEMNNGAITVAAGAVLEGTGTLGGETTISGSLRPGNSIGTMNVLADVTWTGTGTEGTDDWVFELGAGNTSDLLNIGNGGAFLKGEGETYIFDFADATQPGTFTLVQWSSTEDLDGGTLGTSFLLSDFAYTGLEEQEFEGSYFDFSGQSLTFTVIPEPGSIALLLAGAALVAIARRKQR